MDGYQCATCHRCFGRQEHLKRHEQSHTAAQFHCQVCSKSFHRRDALQKHQQTHLLNNGSLRKRGGRACSSCAASKSRCTGELPCMRCGSRQLQCVYPTKRMRTSHNRMDDMSDQDQPIAVNAHSLSLLSTAEQAFTYADHETDSYPVRHDMDSNVLHYTDPIGPPNNGLAFDAQAASYGQSGTFYPPVDQHLVVSPTSLSPNITSTINWLQMDALSFGNDNLQTLFPYPSNHFYATTSLGLENIPQEHSIQHALSESFSNDFGQQRPLTHLLDNTSNPSSSSAIRHDGRSADETAANQLLSPLTDSTVLTDEATVVSGEYYVDGDAGRLPRSKRLGVPTKSMRSLKLIENLEFSLEWLYPVPTSSDPRLCILDEMYQQLSSLHHQLCLETSIFEPFKSPNLPSKSCLEGLLYLYFSHFDQTLPFLHFATFRAEESHGALLLAMMAVGSGYLDCGDTEVFSLSMHEFVRRYLILRTESRYWLQEDSKTLAQIHLLHAIGAGFAQYDPLRSSASISLRSATGYCHDEWASQAYIDEARLHNSSPDWTVWLRQEESLRTGFCIWLFDCMWASQFHHQPYLSLDLATVMRLPCTEKLWAAESAVVWSRSTEGSQNPDGNAFTTPTFLEALQNLYIDKRLLPRLGELSRILLIYGLIRRTSEVKTFVTQTLSTFKPSAQKQESSHIVPKTPAWPPSIPLFNKWRNSACDCLDILHWDANAAVGAASGIEHPTVLHLHLARVLLLGPMREIFLFSEYLIRRGKNSANSLNNDNEGESFPSNSSSAQAKIYCRLIQRWAAHDQYKARLAAIHAGVVFWHVRMYAINAFYEPTAIAFAALLLWALGTFTPKRESKSENVTVGSRHIQHRRDTVTEVDASTAGEGEGEGEAQDGRSSPDYCDIILIDRPTDDELVQQFVRQGQHMHVNLTRVGNLFGPDGPQRVLLEGQRLLNNLKRWQGITNYWIRFLNRLETAAATPTFASNTGSAAAAAAATTAGGRKPSGAIPHE